MTTSRSSVMRNILIAFLVVWFIVSIIIIVVWATSPDLKGASQCRAELQTLQEQSDENRLTWFHDRRALEDMVRQGRANQSLLLNRTRQLQEQLRLHDESLQWCQEKNAVLNANISSLENETVLLKAIEANLTAEISQQQDLIEYLQHNLTQMAMKLKSCTGLHEAAKILKNTAETETAACQTSQQYLEKQLSRCKQTGLPSKPNGNGSPGQSSGIALLMLLCFSLFLIPCKCLS